MTVPPPSPAKKPLIALTPGSRVRVRSAGPDDVVRVKSASPEKSYRVTVIGAVPDGALDRVLPQVLERPIDQRTPTRVAHRRSDKVRPRWIRSVRLVESGPGRFTLDLRAEAGTYIKEWVEGDGGRTDPSLAGRLGVPLKVESLDVLDIHDRDASPLEPDPSSHDARPAPSAVPEPGTPAPAGAQPGKG